MNNYIKKKWGAKEYEDELVRLIRKYNEYRKTYLIVYATAMGKLLPPAALAMDMEDFYIVYDLLKDVDSSGLDFYVETPGGRAETAEEIARFLRGKFEKVSFLVSGQAKSAGTILVMAGDEIFMSRTGSLGPIDAQIAIGRCTISAYDYIEWVNQARIEAERTGRLNPFDATMIAQISPGELKLVHHALKFAEDLVVEWLANYKFKSWTITETRRTRVTDEMRRRRAKEIAGELLNHSKWRTHGRSIKIEDLEQIGLKVNVIDDDPELADLVYRMQTVIRLLFGSTNNYKLFATADEKIFKQATLVTTPASVSTPPGKPVVQVEVKCNKCGRTHRLYMKFSRDPRIDKEMRARGFKPFPKEAKIKCECGNEIGLSGVRNDVESKMGEKIVS